MMLRKRVLSWGWFILYLLQDGYNQNFSSVTCPRWRANTIENSTSQEFDRSLNPCSMQLLHSMVCQVTAYFNKNPSPKKPWPSNQHLSRIPWPMSTMKSCTNRWCHSPSQMIIFRYCMSNTKDGNAHARPYKMNLMNHVRRCIDLDLPTMPNVCLLAGFDGWTGKHLSQFRQS